MRLILVRHGEAVAGFDGVIAGQRGCTGLTDRGRLQAEALRDWLATNGTSAPARLAPTPSTATPNLDTAAGAEARRPQRVRLRMSRFSS